MSDLAGKTVGQYQVAEEIGRGGMAVVYKAWQPSLQRHVALKILPPQFTFDPQFVERSPSLNCIASASEWESSSLEQSAAIVNADKQSAMTTHVRVNDYQITERIGGGGNVTVYRAQDARLGETVALKILREQCAGDELSIERVRKEAATIGSLPDSPHIVKPSDYGEAKVLDFGIARATKGPRLTQTGAPIGRP